ncbi:MAG: hypothetical protein K8F91_17275, partial [Candidatus Obscuribacterales bacterium]|nr:hypothetical protein [Candidatus Obscuribacterales bacterium]
TGDVRGLTIVVDRGQTARARRTGDVRGLTIVVDCGASGAANIESIKTGGHHYLVAAKQRD